MCGETATAHDCQVDGSYRVFPRWCPDGHLSSDHLWQIPRRVSGYSRLYGRRACVQPAGHGIWFAWMPFCRITPRVHSRKRFWWNGCCRILHAETARSAHRVRSAAYRKNVCRNYQNRGRGTQQTGDGIQCQDAAAHIFQITGKRPFQEVNQSWGQRSYRPAGDGCAWNPCAKFPWSGDDVNDRQSVSGASDITVVYPRHTAPGLRTPDRWTSGIVHGLLFLSSAVAHRENVAAVWRPHRRAALRRNVTLPVSVTFS